MGNGYHPNSMRKGNTINYGSLARRLHWSVAILFLCAYCAVYYRHWFTDSDTTANWVALQLHLSFGITTAVFVLLRLIWTFRDQRPGPAAGPRWQQSSAKLMHRLLYFFMIAMPLTGYLGTGVAVDFFGLLTIPKFADTPLYRILVTEMLQLDWESFEAPVDFFHKQSGAWLVWVLIALHAGAALYHHFVKRDEVMLRMFGGTARH